MKRLLVAMTVILLSAMQVSAAVVLDQQHDTATAIADTTSGAVYELAQTFTVGVAGTLDHFEISMFQLPYPFNTTGDPQLSVYNTAAGAPTGTALTTVQIPSSQVQLNNATFVPFNVSAAAIHVTMGEVLAFSIFSSSNPGPYFLPYDGDTGQASNYTAGAVFRRIRPAQPWQMATPSIDCEFRTYVNAASPTYQAGDFNLDGHVNAADIVPLELALANLSNYKATYAPGITDLQLAQIENVNGDGIFNNADLQNLLNILKSGAGSADPVPEPTSLLLLLIGALAIPFRRLVAQSA